MADASKKAATSSTREQVLEQGLLDQIIAQGRFNKDDASRERGRDLVKELVDQVLKGQVTLSANADATISQRIGQIDKLISAQLDEVMHAPEFQKLEASWRGIKYLLDHSETSAMLKIKLLNVSKKELARDLRAAPEFDQSGLFKKVYEEEWGMFGGHPMGAMVGDFEFGKHPEDVELLEKISNVAAAAHAPFISAAAPDLVNLESFTDLGGLRDIGKVFDNTEYAKWKSFRKSDDSRYVGLCLPHILMRLPYGRDTKQVEAFNYEEGVDGRNHKKYLWGNAAYALAARLTAAFSKYGWCAACTGVQGGGLVEGLPTHNFKTDEGDIAMKCPTEVGIAERRAKELQDFGFIPLEHCKNTDYAAFFAAQSCQQPSVYDKAEANANARLSAQLPYILAMSRFAHYLKAMMRDYIGSNMTRAECQRFLNNWISQYVSSDDSAVQSVKAQFPLREANIEVSDVPGKPGVYRAVAFLKPHFQLSELSVSLRLVAELPKSARG